MSEPTKDKFTAKKLPCGGIAIYGVDVKTKQVMQVGYIGPGLNAEAFLPKDCVVQK